MKKLFRYRAQAGQLLADALLHYANREDVLVLGLPRGGVPVAFEVAAKLDAALDAFVVRKLGFPGHAELALGAIATGGVRLLNEAVIEHFRLSKRDIDAVAVQEQKELARCELAYRGHRPPPRIRGKTIILVDDGVATGATMLAAVRAVRLQQPASIVVAVPTAPPSTSARVGAEADEMIALMMPEDFYAVGQWYEVFSHISEAEVTALLAQASRPLAPAGLAMGGN
jgi:putative phosphoribosyl transferase